MGLMIADVSIGAMSKNKLNQKHSLLQFYLQCFHYYCLLPATSLPILRGLDLTEIFQVTSLLCRFCHYEVEHIFGKLNFSLFSFDNFMFQFFIALASVFCIISCIIFKTLSKKRNFQCFSYPNSYCYHTGFLILPGYKVCTETS